MRDSKRHKSEEERIEAHNFSLLFNAPPPRDESVPNHHDNPPGPLLLSLHLLLQDSSVQRLSELSSRHPAVSHRPYIGSNSIIWIVASQTDR